MLAKPNLGEILLQGPEGVLLLLRAHPGGAAHVAEVEDCRLDLAGRDHCRRPGDSYIYLSVL